MVAIRGTGSDPDGTLWVEPNWLPEGKRVVITSTEVRQIEQTAKPPPDVKPDDGKPVVVTPVAVDGAKVDTLQFRLDRSMPNRLVVSIVGRKGTGFQVSDR